MTTSAHGSTSSWGAEPWPVEDGSPEEHRDGIDDHDLLAQDAPALAWDGDHDVAPDDLAAAEEPLDHLDAPWGELNEATSEGLTGRALILTTALAAGGCAALDLALTSGRLTFFFDLCFVVICLVATMAVRRKDLFTAGVLPPLVFAVIIGAVAIAAPDAFESAPGVNKVFLTGLANHAGGLVGGYAVALLAVAARMAGSDRRDR